MKIFNTYSHLIKQLLFLVVIVIVMGKPVFTFYAQSTLNQDDVEFLEDIDEEDTSQNELEDDNSKDEKAVGLLYSKINKEEFNKSVKNNWVQLKTNTIENEQEVQLPPPKEICV